LARKRSVSSKERDEKDVGSSGPKLKRQKTIQSQDDLDMETKEWLSTKFWKSFEPTIENF